jgi:hypothetical protein
MLSKTPSGAGITKTDRAVAHAVRHWLIAASLEFSSGPLHVSFVTNEEAFEHISERVCLDLPH